MYFAFYPNQIGAGNCLTIKKKVRPLQYREETERRSRFKSMIKIISEHLYHLLRFDLII
jgi:hypothetical protein